jgi:uncharacterized protein (TIGR02001 family)
MGIVKTLGAVYKMIEPIFQNPAITRIVLFRIGFNAALQTLCGILLLFHFSPSEADFHGTITATTNNADRWFSKSDNEGALIANLDYEHTSGLYVGSSVSNVEFEFNEIEHQAAHVEVTPYLGWSIALPKQWRMDLQWTGYLYDGHVFGHNADYHEFYVFLHYQDIFTGRVSVANDYYGTGEYTIDYALTGRYPLTDAFQLSATFGYSQTHVALGSDYPYWNISLTYAYKFLKLALRYMDAAETNIDPILEEKMHGLYDPPVLNADCVFSISAGF